MMNGMGTPRNNSKIDRMASLLYLESQMVTNWGEHGFSKPQPATAKQLRRDLFAYPQWSRRNSRKTRQSTAQGTPTTMHARSLCGQYLPLVAPLQKHQTPASQHRFG